MTIRLLVTARDAAAALHLVQVIQACRNDNRIEVVIAAQRPAVDYFLNAGIEVEILPSLSARSPESPEAVCLRGIARQLLDEVRPDAVLVGLSTPFDAGLDEAVLAEARVPTILFQDFWGEQNLIFGKAADLVLAIDAEAASLNFSRFGIRSRIVGSARHAAYANLDIPSIREKVRTKLGVGRNERVVGFFGQALHRLPGYARTIQAFIDALTSIDSQFKLIVRPHPRENDEQREKTRLLFERSGLMPLIDLEGPVENALIACDVVCSLFSTCTYDAAYLNRFSLKPVAVPVSMLFDEEIEAYCRQHVNFETFPHHCSGTVLSVHERRELESVIRQSLKPEMCEQVWRNAQTHLPDPAGAPRLVLDEVVKYLGERPVEARD